jgi:hypothetical protein
LAIKKKPRRSGAKFPLGRTKSKGLAVLSALLAALARFLGLLAGLLIVSALLATLAGILRLLAGFVILTTLAAVLAALILVLVHLFCSLLLPLWKQLTTCESGVRSWGWTLSLVRYWFAHSTRDPVRIFGTFLFFRWV